MKSFHKYGFNENILISLNQLNFLTPTPIQDKVIPIILNSDTDIIATAQTGTGKTAAFGLPIIELTNNKNKNIECVILCPTRELCIQISKDLNTYSRNLRHYKITSIYGGSKIQGQIKDLKQNPKIVVCTPGRLNDLIKRRKINLSLVKYFVLDEADEMLSMGFKNEIDKILEKIPEDRKIYLFSATISKKVEKVTETYMQKPLVISTSAPNQGAKNIKHLYYVCNKNKRYDILKNIIDANTNIYTIIFCRTRRETKDISRKFISDNYNAKVLNGDLSQSERDLVMRNFRTKKINILIATDVASRGIDVNNLSHIINYNLPDDSEVYIHRSGRTGRAGNRGESIVLVSKNELRRLKEIEQLSKITFNQLEPPTKNDIIKSKIYSFTNEISNTPLLNDKDKDNFKKICLELNKFSKDELIEKIINMKINKTLNKTPKTEKNIDSSNQNKSTRNATMMKLSINIGRSNKITPESLIKIINKSIRSRNTEIGKININKYNSTFEVNANMAESIILKMSNIRHYRKTLSVIEFSQNEKRLEPNNNRNKNRFKKRRSNRKNR